MAIYRSGILQLYYARAQQLGPWLDRVAVRGEMVVQFWLKPGETAVKTAREKWLREDGYLSV